MDELFIYSWEVLDENPIKIRGHGLDINNNYDYIDINNYQSFCYYDSDKTKLIGEDVFMETSDNIYVRKPFKKIYSSNKNDLKGHMGELNTISVFTADTGLEYSGWISKTTKKSINKDTHPYPLIMSFDIEVTTNTDGMPVPYKDSDKIEIISCVFQRYKDDTLNAFILHLDDYELNIDDCEDYLLTKVPCSTEIHIIEQFFTIINDINPDVITGFNIYGFDFTYIVSKLQYYQIYAPMCTRPNLHHFTLEDRDWESSAYGYNKYKKIKINGRVIFDMILYFNRFKLEKYSLDVISKTFLNEGKQDMPYKEMFRRFRERYGLDEVADYCIKDSILVIRLFDKFSVWNELCETSKIMRCDMEDIYTRGEQLKITNQMIKECIDRKVVLVQRDTEQKRDYGGATVLDPVIGIHNNCAVLDFQSLYPSIIVTYNICPSTICRDFSKSEIGLFPHCIQRLLTERKKVKDIIKSLPEDASALERIVLDKKQNALKISANSMYGIMGFASNKYFGSISCAEKVTGVGRSVLIDTIDYIKEYFDQVEVIYGDTDSCMLKFPEYMDHEYVIEYSKFIADTVSDNLYGSIKLQFEEYYKKMILMNKKRYIMVKLNNELKFKGVMIARRGYCEYAKEIYRSIIDMISKDYHIDEIKQFVDNKIRILSLNRVPLESLVITKSVKDVNSYKVQSPQVVMAKRLLALGHKITAGTRLEYVFVQVDQKSASQGERMYTPEEYVEGDMVIDYEYYTKKQISSQVDELLQLVGLENYVKKWFSHF
jgi:DNA polymerase delta subunit 1